MTNRIIDVSGNQPHPINWQSVKAAGVAGAIVKVSEGTHYISDSHVADVTALRQLGMVVGHYHYASPETGTTPESEAAYFINAVGPIDAGEIVVLDLETPTDLHMGDMSAWALAFLSHMETALGFKPFLYSYPFYIEDALTDSRLAAYPLWLAAYDVAQCPPSCGVWSTVTLWQHTWQMQVPGIAGNVDESYYYPDLAQLKALGKPAPVPTGPPPGPHFTVTTATNLRQKPAKNSPYVKPPYLLQVGQIVTGAEGQTPHWKSVYIPGRGTATGWAYLLDLKSIP